MKTNDLLEIKANSPAEKAQALVQLEAIKKQINVRIAEYKTELLEVMQAQRALTLKTEDYTVTRAKRVTPQVVDFKLLKQSLDEANIPYETHEVFIDQMSIVFKQLIDDKKNMPGLEASETEYIMVRIAKEKK